MKKLLSTVMLGMAISGAALAGPVTIDPTMDNDFSDAVTFDELDFRQVFPVSYYIDSSEDGYVNNGEFVFDFGTDVKLAEFQFDNAEAANSDSGNFGDSEQFTLVADYLLVGEAVVSSQSAASIQTIIDLMDLGVTVEQYVIDNITTCLADPNPTDLCLAVIDVYNEDGVVDGDAGELLFANISSGVFNLFLKSNITDERTHLATSFSVSETVFEAGFGGAFSLNILGTAIEAASDLMFSTQSGDSFDDIISDPSLLNPTLKVDTNVDVAVGNFEAIPGAHTSKQVGTTNATGTQTADGDDLYYYTKNNFTVWDITRIANSCVRFGACAPAVPAGPADNLWDSLKADIRNAGGCTNGNTCQYEVLARQTETDPSGSISVSAPGTLMLTGLALLVMGLRRKFF